jgi:tetrapyrrole methylase family protein/MazG family protein
MTDHPTEPITSIAKALAALYELVLYLRSEHGCPWDKKQDLKSMFEYLRGETVELGEEIAKGRPEGISEEWGDVLFILLMIAAIGKETGEFNIEEALLFVETKMIRRHPHVFGSSDVSAVGELLTQWEDIKTREKSELPDSLMDAVPLFYSALKRADHIQKKAAEVGFDWPDHEGVIAKIEEEARELRDAVDSGSTTEACDELGDLLFSCVNLARFKNTDPDLLLNKTIDKFVKRFKYIETQLRRDGKSLEEATLAEMDAIWEESKTKLDRSESNGDCD